MSNQETKYTCIDPDCITKYRAPNFHSLLTFFQESNYELIEDEKFNNSWDNKYTLYPENVFSSFPRAASIIIENRIDLKNPDFTSLNHNDTLHLVEFYNQISKLIFFFQDAYRKQQQTIKNES